MHWIINSQHIIGYPIPILIILYHPINPDSDTCTIPYILIQTKGIN